MLFLRAEKKGQFKIQINQQFCKTIEGRKKKKTGTTRLEKSILELRLKKKKREREIEKLLTLFFFLGEKLLVNLIEEKLSDIPINVNTFFNSCR